MRKILLLFAFLCLAYSAALAQTGKLAGKLIDKTSREPIAFAPVVAKLNGAVKGYGQTGVDGSYSISPLVPGSYTVESQYVGYNPIVISGVEVNLDKTTFLNVDMISSINSTTLTTVEIKWEAPLIGPDKQGETLTKDQITKLATRDVSTAATTVAGVYAADDGKGVSIKGQRSAGTVYYVNGVKQLVAPQLPTNAISQMTVLTGGIPAQYGDATGGIVNITTSGPSSKLQGGVEAETSTFLDQYNNNLINFNLTGPLLKKKSTDSTDLSGDRTMLGFFLAGQYQSSKDDNPSAQGVWHLKDAVKDRISKAPYTNDPNGGYTDAASRLTFADMENNNVRENVKSNRVILNTSIDYQPKENMMFTLGGSYDRSDRNNYLNAFSLYNSENNPQQIIKNWNTYLRFTQNFKDDINDTTKSIKNAYYQIQFDYSKYDRVIQNERLKDNLFRYGYFGKIEEVTKYDEVAKIRLKKNPNSTDPTDTATVVFEDVFVNNGVKNGVVLSPTNDNPNLAAYSQYVIDDRASTGLPVQNLIDLQLSRGLLNGQTPNYIMSNYANTGSIYPLYSLLNNDQFRMSALGSAEWGKHTFKLGFEFEQRVNTGYSINAGNLWQIARGLVSTDITGVNKSKYTVSTQMVNDTARQFIDFDNFAAANQSTFSKNLREKLGYTATQEINIDAVSPDDLSLGMFGVNELVDPGIVSYQGFDYKGNRSTKKVSFEEYFSDVNNRPQDAIRPIYTSAFIEDKFQIEDLTLRAGIRIDRFDANQKVLKDPYSLVDVMHASDVRDLSFANGYKIPSNVGDDFVVYLNKTSKDFSRDAAATYEITGYRSGTVFYDANGTPTENISTVTQNGAFPLFDPNAQGNKGTEYLEDRFLSVKAFKDYEPQINVMPRLSFSFPISEDALFFAHYDVLTQRPEQNGTLPSDYYFLFGSVGDRNTLNNPDLRPQKKIDYEVGFEQRLTRSSGLTISAFYSENRDQIAYQKYFGAFPQDYVTFGNLDFGTVKGMTLEYDLRRTKNVYMNASYTLQYAKGTGSSSTSGFNLVSQGAPNLRTPIPLDYDQRHAFKLNIDFRLKNNEGPVLFGNKIFQNAGINVIFNGGSGTPYSRQANVTNFIDPVGRPVLKGGLNGSNLPGNFRVGLKIDKDFNMKAKTEDGTPFVKSLNVYLRVQNLLNTKNVLNVYRYTGSAEDDGYLDTYYEKTAVLDQALIDLYTIRLLNGDNDASNPTNYSLPRRVYLGCTLTF